MATCFRNSQDSTPPEGLERHPCFNGDAHHKFGRIHLPVAPVCNIQCRFCKRGFNKGESRPGLAVQLVTPAEAPKIVERALRVCPEITVVGIAGPGDPLASDHALKTLDAVHRRFPDLIMCLSTNGLELSRRAEDIVRVGVKMLTVTVNGVDPEILEQICAHVHRNGAPVSGQEGASLLIASQLAGIMKIVDLGVLVKINTVLIPGINDTTIEEIARVTAGAGASMINIVPIIPQFEMEFQRPPFRTELNKAQEDARKHLPVFTHCRQCRADACGVPGRNEDFGVELYGRVAPTFSHG